MTITELLRTEHAAFNAILDEIETALPNAATLGELRILVNLIAGFLQQHGHKEEEILCPALDQMQGQRGQMKELTQEHGELDQQIRQVAKNRDLKKLGSSLANSSKRCASTSTTRSANFSRWPRKCFWPKT